MKTFLKSIIACLTLSLVILGSTGCSKKPKGPSPEEIAAAQAAEQAAAEAEAKKAAEEAAAAAAAAQAEAEAKARKEAEAAALALAAAQAEAEAKAAAEAAKAKAEAERKAQEEAKAAALAAAKAEAEAKAKAAEDARLAQVAEASRLYDENKKAADKFRADMAALSNLIDRNADQVKVKVADNLLEMRALMPGLVAKFESLKNFKGGNLDATVAAIESEFDRTNKLYKETMDLLPEELKSQL